MRSDRVRFVIYDVGRAYCDPMDEALAVQLEREVQRLSQACAAATRRPDESHGAPVGVFFEVLEPPVPLVILGAGPDALPIVEPAATWDGGRPWSTFRRVRRVASASR